MKAVVKTAPGFGNIEIKDVPVPEIGQDEILVKVRAAAMCGTDMEIYRGEFKTVIPVIPGHEFSGEVEKVGKNVRSVVPGDRVVSETSNVICGKCYYCRTGRYNLCAERKGLGYGANGAFAEYVRIPEFVAHKIPPRITFDEAALCEPLSVATRAVGAISDVHAADNVVVVGAGAISLFLLQVVKASGAGKIIVTEINDDRLKMAKQLGADATVNVKKEDALQRIREETNGVGADIVFEATGSPQAVPPLLDYVRKAGEVVIVGVFPKPVEIDVNKIVMNELKVLSSWTSGVFTDWNRSLTLLEKNMVTTKPLITHRFPLEKWLEGTKLMEKQECIRIVFRP